jgi:hypothetical protein
MHRGGDWAFALGNEDHASMRRLEGPPRLEVEIVLLAFEVCR